MLETELLLATTYNGVDVEILICILLQKGSTNNPVGIQSPLILDTKVHTRTAYIDKNVNIYIHERKRNRLWVML